MASTRNAVKRLMPTVKTKKSLKGLARRSSWSVKVKGVDITELIKQDLISLEISDFEEGEADDLQIKVADRDGVWLQKWLNESVQKGAKKNGLTFTIKIGSSDEKGKLKQQKTGSFSMDSMKASGPPATVTIKCTSLDFSGGIRTEKKSKSWEGYKLRGIASEIATNAGLNLLYCSKKDPTLSREEQDDETDISFLIRLCDKQGLFVKIYNKKLVVFERGPLEKQNPAMDITFGDGSYTKWELSTESADTTYDYCTVRYTNPKTGKTIEGTYYSQAYYDEEEEDEDEHEHVGLIITDRKVESIAEAQALAEVELNLKNLYERTVTLTLPGNPMLMAGLPVRLKKCGYWTGKYMIYKCVHSISKSGYTTKLTLRYIQNYDTESTTTTSTDSSSGDSGSGSDSGGNSGNKNKKPYTRSGCAMYSSSTSSTVVATIGADRPVTFLSASQNSRAYVSCDGKQGWIPYGNIYYK